MQVDQRVLDADPVEWLVGARPGMGRQPPLVRLDVRALEVGAAGHLRVGVGEPGTELTQVTVDGADRARTQAHCDLLDVAARRGGEFRCDRCPSGHRDRWLHCRRAEQGESAGMEEGQPQPVQDRRDVLAGTGAAAPGVRGRQLGASSVEAGVVERPRRDSGDRGDLDQQVPLRRRVPAGDSDARTYFTEPAVVLGAEPPRGDAGTQVGAAEQFGVDGDPAGGHQPGRVRASLRDCIGLPGRAQRVPAAGATDLGLATMRRLGRRPAGLSPGGPHRGQVVLDDPRVVVVEQQRRARHGSSIACASIASTARRYSPASQSLAR